MKLETVVTTILRTGGISLTASGELFKGQTGYIVGVSSSYHECLSDALLALQDAIETARNLGPTTHTITAGAYRMDNGGYSVDLGLHLPGREVAECLGMALDQESIYDVAAGECIPTHGRGGKGVELVELAELANTNEAQLMAVAGFIMIGRDYLKGVTGTLKVTGVTVFTGDYPSEAA